MPNSSPEYRAYKLLQQVIIGCTALILIAVLGMFLSASNKSAHRCDDLQNLRSYVLHSTDRAIKSLPTIAYYRQHPQERQAALENLVLQREQFADPLDCSLF